MKNIKILSLNTMGVPFAPNRKIRFGLIADFIKNYSPDIVALQEVGDKFLLNFLIKQITNYHFYPKKVNGLINTHGALLLLTKKSLSRYKFTKFNVGGGPFFPFSLVEKLSCKGWQVGELGLKGRNITIINTHLLASFFNNKREYEYMEMQLDELSKYINLISKKGQLIVTGDFNFPSTHRLYKKFLKTTRCNDPLHGTDEYTHDKSNLNIAALNSFLKNLSWGNKREDYTFLSGFSKNKITQKIYKEKYKLSNKTYDLSDHYGILTTINL